MKQRKKKNGQIFAWGRLTWMLALLFLAVTWISLDNLFVFIDKETVRSVEIPNFCGLLFSEIEFCDWLEPHVEYRYDDGVPAGEVVSQLPLAGSCRKLGEAMPMCDVTLVVSLGKESIVLPDVVGQDVQDAALTLRQQGFVVHTQMRSGPYAVGEVIAMEPQAGTPLLAGDAVTLIACTGEETQTVTVPELRGMARSEALMQLWLCRLQVAYVVEESSYATADMVIRQSHQPGTLVLAGTRITLYVSAGAE